MTGQGKKSAANSFEVGDKVKLKTGSHRGARGLVEAVADDKIVVRANGIQRLVTLSSIEVTNFSLAARKAWLSMPKRQVGRPKGSKFCDRVSVTLRIDRDLWEHFRAQERSGLIDDRTATINKWLKEKLGQVTLEQKDS
jgi:hypothetical protein